MECLQTGNLLSSPLSKPDKTGNMHHTPNWGGTLFLPLRCYNAVSTLSWYLTVKWQMRKGFSQCISDTKNSWVPPPCIDNLAYEVFNPLSPCCFPHCGRAISIWKTVLGKHLDNLPLDYRWVQTVCSYFNISTYSGRSQNRTYVVPWSFYLQLKQNKNIECSCCISILQGKEGI